MPERRSRRFEVRLTRTAQRDVKAILNWSRKEFGEASAARYKALVKQALRDIGADPERPGSTGRPEIPIEGAHTYHLWYSRGRVKGQGVKAPRHFLLYRRKERVIEVGCGCQDAREGDLRVWASHAHNSPFELLARELNRVRHREPRLLERTQRSEVALLRIGDYGTDAPVSKNDLPEEPADCNRPQSQTRHRKFPNREVDASRTELRP